jgi:hypothetical protein
VLCVGAASLPSAQYVPMLSTSDSHAVLCCVLCCAVLCCAVLCAGTSPGIPLHEAWALLLNGFIPLMAQEAHAMADLLLMYRSVGLEANRWKEETATALQPSWCCVCCLRCC